LLLVVAGIFAFYWFANQWIVLARSAAVVAGLALGGFVFAGTQKGRQTLEFLSESRFELRKVVWPTRQEAARMTWVVMIVVVLISLMLAGFDAVIRWLVRLLLGQ
jgi:preprotein translocase subunit SecE